MASLMFRARVSLLYLAERASELDAAVTPEESEIPNGVGKFIFSDEQRLKWAEVSADAQFEKNIFGAPILCAYYQT